MRPGYYMRGLPVLKSFPKKIKFFLKKIKIFPQIMKTVPKKISSKKGNRPQKKEFRSKFQIIYQGLSFYI
jgi:hypothetical protein